MSEHKLRTDENIHVENVFDDVKVLIVDGNDPAGGRKQLCMSILIFVSDKNKSIFRMFRNIPQDLNARHTPRSV